MIIQLLDDVYETLEDYNPTKKKLLKHLKIYMIADMEADETLRPLVTKLFLREKKLDISLVFILQYYFRFPKTIRLNATHYFIIKIPNIRKPQLTAPNHSSNTEFKDSRKLFKDYVI